MSSYASYSSLFAYAISEVALTGIFITPLFIIWVISLCLARRNGDHARVGFAWMKAVYPMWILALIFRVASLGLQVFLDDYYYYSSSSRESIYYHGLEASIRMSDTSLFLEMVTNALLILCFVELGNGFWYCLTGARTSAQKMMRFAAIGCAVFSLILGIAWYGFDMSLWSPYFSWHYDYLGSSSSRYDSAYDDMIDTVNAQILTSDRLKTAYDIIYWIMTIPLVVLGAFVVHKVKGVPTLRHSSVLFLVANVLNFFRCTWIIAYDATWILPLQVRFPLYARILRPLLGSWPVFVLLVLLFVMGIRKNDGLWSTKQFGSANGAQTSYAPVTYVMQQPPQQYQQYQQPQQYQQYQQYPAQPGYTNQQPMPETK